MIGMDGKDVDIQSMQANSLFFTKGQDFVFIGLEAIFFKVPVIK